MWSPVKTNKSETRIFCSVLLLYICVSESESHSRWACQQQQNAHTHTHTHTEFHTFFLSLCLSVSVTLIGCSQGVRAWDRQQEKGERREEVDECGVTLLFTWLIFTNRPTNTYSLTYTVCVPGPLSSVCSDYLNFVLKFNEEKSVGGGSAFNTIIHGYNCHLFIITVIGTYM